MKKITALLIAAILCCSLFIPTLPVSAAEETGYCAVGEVDQTRAAVLLADGSILNVPFSGEAPTPGTVCRYLVTDGSYLFTAVSFPGYSAWRIFDNPDENGDYFWDGGQTYGFLADTAVGFLKFSDTSWRIAHGKHMITIAEGVGDMAGTAWPCNIEALWNDGLQKMDLIFADCSKTYPKGPQPGKLFDPSGAGFTSGDLEVVLSDLPAPEPPQIIKRRFCAVGEVDETAGLASVLTADGTVRTVRYEGTAPVSGRVHLMTEQDGVFRFTEHTYYAEGAQWRVFDGQIEGSAEQADFFSAYDASGGETRLYCAEDCVTFIRFSPTNWAVVKGGNAIGITSRLDPDFDYTAYPSGLMFSWNTAELVSMQSQIDSVFCDAEAYPDATRYYTADQSRMIRGDKELRIETSPETADRGIGAAAAVLAAVGMITVCRKRGRARPADGRK